MKYITLLSRSGNSFRARFSKIYLIAVLMTFMGYGFTANAQCCITQKLVSWDMDACLANANNTDFSEFTADVEPCYPGTASTLTTTAPHHSCWSGANGSLANLCVPSGHTFTLATTASPPIGQAVSIKKLDFYVSYILWSGVGSISNYILVVKVDGIQVHSQVGSLPLASQVWKNEVIDLSSVSALQNIYTPKNITYEITSSNAGTNLLFEMDEFEVHGLVCPTAHGCTGPLNPGSIGTSQYVCDAFSIDPAAFTSIAPASGPCTVVTYQWQKRTGTSGSFSNIAGATNATYDADTLYALYGTTQFRRAAKGTPWTYSNIVTVGFNEDLLNPGTIGNPQALCNSGNPAPITNVSSPSGGVGIIEYIWQVSPDQNTWSTISGATGPTYDPPGTVTTDTYYRRGARRYSCSNYKYTSPVKITVYKELTNPGSIGSPQTFCNSGDVLSITQVAPASGGTGGIIEYSWQMSTNNSTWSTISGTNYAGYNPGIITTTTYYRRGAKYSNPACGGYKYTSSVEITVNTPFASGGTIGSDQTLLCGSTPPAPLTNIAAPSGGSGSNTPQYQWQRRYNTNGGFSNISGATGATYSPPYINTPVVQYRRRARRGNCSGSKFSNVVTITLSACQVTVAGNVFNDLDGLTDNDVDGTGIGSPSNTPVYANLIDPSGNVVATAQIGTNGTYQFPNVTANTTYTMLLSTTQGTVGNPAPSADLPGDWMNTGESPNNATSDGTPDGVQTVVVGTSNVSNIDFGIQQPPTPGTDTRPSEVNPGGNAFVSVPSTSFSATDPSAGTITSIRIIAFPTNTSAITINGTTYTQSNWPSAGITIPTNTSGEPNWPITLDPVNGAVTPTILYKAIDNAGIESVNTGDVKLPFSVIGISGTVSEDNDGPSEVNGTGVGNPSSTPLYANLVDPSGNVVDRVAVSSNGAYNFSEVSPNMNYTVVLSTTQGTVGSPAPTADLPFGWKNVSEDCCDNSGNDGNANGIVNVSVGTTTLSNVNFGITQPMVIGNSVFNDLNQNGKRDSGEPLIQGATVKLYKDDNNDGVPDGAALTMVTTSSSGYYEFGDLVPGNYIIGVTPPTPTSGSAYESSNGPSQSANPNDNVNDDDNGVHTVGSETRSGTIIMATGSEPTNDDPYAGVPDENSDMSIDFGFFQPIRVSGIVFNDESGPANVDGSPIGQAGSTQLYANLIKPDGTVDQVTPISNLGMYEFTDVKPNTAYKIILTDVPFLVGSQEPPASLPNGWVTVSEDCCDGIGNDGTPDGINQVTTGTMDLSMANFGIREPVAVGNMVWIDENQNGVKDANETPLQNAIVSIYEDVNNDGNPDGPAIGTVTTGNDGLYSFMDLHSGKYIIGVVPPTIQNGSYISPTIGEEANPNLDVNGNDNGVNQVGTEIRSGTINLIAGAEPTGEVPNNTSSVPDANSNLTIDFAFYACPSTFQFIPVDLCLNNTFDLTSAEPAEFTGGVWTENNQVVAAPTAVSSGTYTYNYNNGSCSATGSLLITDNIPDFTPTIQIAPSAITGSSQVRIVFTISEIAGKDGCSDVYVSAPKFLPRFQFTFDNNATVIGGVAVNNADWEYYENANPNFYIWKYTGTAGLFPRSGSSKIGYIGTYDPNNTDGQSTFSVQVFQGSGGETNMGNNTDSDILIHFK